MQFGDRTHPVNALHSSPLWTGMATHLTGITIIRVNKSGSIGQFVAFLKYSRDVNAEAYRRKLDNS